MSRRAIGSTGLRLTTLGLGAAPLGNLYSPVSDAEAAHVAARALERGLRYVDTAPYYGFGLSERRVGDAVRGRKDVVVSTKVGRLLVPDPRVTDDAERCGFRSALPFRPAYDYSFDGVMRSFDDSLQRLGLARVDILYVHDIGRLTHGGDAGRRFAELTDGGGLRALAQLRGAGRISAFGVGVNEVAACLEVMGAARLDVILLAGRYTLLEQAALDELLPRAQREGVSIVIGGPYNSGILASGVGGGAPAHYNYAPAPDAVIERVRDIEQVCRQYEVPLPAAALQFPLAHPAVVSVIPGVATVERLDQAIDHQAWPIPAAFWTALRAQGLLRPDAPTPGGLA